MAPSRLLVAAAATVAGALADGASGYQQYIAQYGGDDQKYVQGAGAGGKQGGNYQQYMKGAGSAGSFQQFMQAAGATTMVAEPTEVDVDEPTELHASHKSHLKHKSHHEHTSHHAHGSHPEHTSRDEHASADTHKEHASGASSLSQGFDYQQYMQGAGDYQTYMQGAGGSGKQGSVAGGYQQYMQGAGDYQTYMQGAGGSGQQGSGAGGYQQYMQGAGGYQKYMQGAGGSGKQGSGVGGYQQYMSSFMPAGGSGDGSQSDMINQRASAHVSSPKNTSDNQAWGNQFMGKYAGAYSKHTQMQNGQGGGQQVPYTAEDCKNLTQLKAWREGQKKQIKNFVPQAFQDGPMKSIEAEYKKNEARIHNETKVEKDAEEKREEEATEKKEKDEQNDDTREKKGSKPKALSEVPVDNSTNAAAPVELSEQTHSQAFLFVPVLGVAAVLGAAAMSLMHRMRREVVPDQYLSLEAEP